MENALLYSQIRELVQSAGSRIFVIKFIKKDGTPREMHVQSAIGRFHVKGTNPEATQKRANNHPNLLNLWDISEEGFRSVNMDTVFEIRMDKKVYTVEGNQLVTGVTNGAGSS